jgi:sugar phosphate permease
VNTAAAMAEPSTTAPRRRWLVLAAGVLAQAATSMFQFGVPYLLPQLRNALGGSLSGAALLVACPSIGLMLTLIAWGAVADRYGERLAMTAGLLGAAAVLGVAGFSHSAFMLGLSLVLAGATGASVNAASGRALMGWFAAHERGLAMGVRQTAQPLGVGMAALVLPAAAASFGYQGALWVPAVICLIVGVFVAVAVQDPPRAAGEASGRTPSPYRRPDLWQVHGASALLIVPQFTVSAFAFVYLVSVRHWPAASAGGLLATAQVAGAAARLLAGRWSDRVADRLGPMRTLAVINASVVGLLAASAAAGSSAAPVLLVAAAAITVSGNGLAFTAVAELAGRQWSGRALGAQNTIQNLIAAATPPLFGLLITTAGYASAFLLATAFAAAATTVVPRSAGQITWGTPPRGTSP